jgi:hypothetical protein
VLAGAGGEDRDEEGEALDSVSHAVRNTGPAQRFVRRAALGLQSTNRMRGFIGVFLLIAGCSGVEGRQPAGVATTQSEVSAPIGCVEVGGGELQEGLNLGLGGGNVSVTAVQRHGGNPIGFAVSSTATNLFFIVTSDDVSCSDGDSFLSASPITRVEFCAGANGCL